MASTHAGFAWSSDTPSTVKLLFLNLLYAATTFGFSILQGLHQLAQKSTSTYFPRKEEIFTIFPEVSACENSLIIEPIGFILDSMICWLAYIPNEVAFIASGKRRYSCSASLPSCVAWYNR